MSDSLPPDRPSLTWDDEAKAGYLAVRGIKPGEVARTVEMGGADAGVLVDLDASGDVLGVEFLHDVRLSTLRRWLLRLGLRIEHQVESNAAPADREDSTNA